MHDHIIGMFRGQAGPMLCMTEGHNTEADPKTFDQPTPYPDADAKQNKDALHEEDPTQRLNAAIKDAGKGKQGGKSYGES